MNNQCINIAISGLGLTTSDELKIRLRKLLPNNIGINWTNISDQNINCILINEHFFEHDNIQNIIQSKKIPYLKISKHSDQDGSTDENLLCFPINDELTLKDWVNIKLLNHSSNQPEQKPALILDHIDTDLKVAVDAKEIDFFTNIYQQDIRKILINDQFGTLAIIDHHAHLAWLEPTREAYRTDLSIQYTAANTTDFIKVSRKQHHNLENWLFNLIWQNPNIITIPSQDKSYRLKFWPQPNMADKKILLQLSGCFILGAEIQHVANKLNISVQTVQHFIAANFAINNVEIIPTKDCQFNKPSETENQTENQGFLKSFFGKLKSRFKF
ncbi:hypothetical protein [Acinetobacter piscicola]|uniref:hypothetical protein n=1 Tax=Acinetobacter piscicola TaxID=2006115 RepID=UPI000B7F03D4|nr:hypothetical protein [Acinetobacter piscicola]